MLRDNASSKPVVAVPDVTYRFPMSAWPLADAEFGVVGAAPSQDAAGTSRSPVCHAEVATATVVVPLLHPFRVWRWAGIHSAAFDRARLRSALHLTTSGTLLASDDAVCTLASIPTRRVAIAAWTTLLAVVVTPVATIAALVTSDASSLGATAWLAAAFLVVLAACVWAAQNIAQRRRWPAAVSGEFELGNLAARVEGTGAGGRLLDHALDRVEGRGGTVILRVQLGNERALRLYRSRSFVESDLAPRKSGEIVMERVRRARSRVNPPSGTIDVLLVLTAVGVVVGSAAILPSSPLSVAATGSTLGCLLAASFMDRREGRVPNELLVLGALLAFVASDAAGTVASSGLGALVAATPLLLLHLVDPSALGFGDVKFAAVGGGLIASISWPSAVLVPLVALAIAAAIRLGGHRDARPFAPDLMLATTAGLIAATALQSTGGLQ